MFPLTVKLDQERQQSLGDLHTALSLVHLPAASGLWQQWIEEGRLVVEERQDGELYWRWNGDSSEYQDHRERKVQS